MELRGQVDGEVKRYCERVFIAGGHGVVYA